MAVQGPGPLQRQPLTEHENLGPAFDPTLPPPDQLSGLGSILPCLMSLGQLLGTGLSSPSTPSQIPEPGEETDFPPGVFLTRGSPSRHILHRVRGKKCLHQALSTQQKVKAEVSRLPSNEAASEGPEPQQVAFLSPQMILFFPSSFYCC